MSGVAALYNIVQQFHNLKDSMKTPYIYEIEPTNHCPYKCIMCPRGLGRMSRPVGFMKLEILRCLLDQLPKTQKLIRLHHFGEAILHPEIDNMVRTVSERGLVSVLSLNPATLTSKLIREILAAGISVVCFSLDAFSDQGMMQIRGIKRSFKKCWSMIEDFIEASRNSGAFVLKVIQMVSLELNKHNREEFWRIKEQYPEPDIYLYLAQNTGFGDLNLVEKTQAGGSRNILSGASPCGAPFSEISVLWNGDVVLCCYDYDGFNVIGNVREKPLSEIWQDEEVKRIRNIFESRRTQSLPLCARCFQAPHNFSKEIPLSRKGWEEESAILQILLTSKERY